MKRYIGLALLMFLVQFAASQNIVKMSAVKSNDFGVAYSLPKTEIIVKVNYQKKTRTAGEFYRFSERYLSVSNPITQNAISYSLEKIEAATIGIPDKSESYLVEFKANTVAPFVMLTKDGVICAINEEVEFAEEKPFSDQPVNTNRSTINPKSYLSEEILRAGSTAKQAELIAKQIYRLRESKTNILTGEADNMPPDGDSYKLVMNQIDEQEKALTSMFIGTEIIEIETKEFKLIPDRNNIEKRTLFRFSSKLGVVEPNNLAGEPISLSLISKYPIEEVSAMTDKEQKQWDAKFSKGIIYNVPVKASLKIDFNGKSLFQKECDIVQYGTKEVLTPKQLEYKKDAAVKIIFYPELGAVKQITQ